MSEMEQEIVVQLSLYDQIKKLWTNYQKAPISRRSEHMIRSRLDSLEKYWDLSLQRHASILTLSSAEIRSKHEYFTKLKFEAISDSVEEVRDNLNDALVEFTKPSSDQEETKHAFTKPSDAVDLSPINIKKFSGDLDEWIGFRDLFLSTVGNRKDLSDVKKFHYLINSLEGHAARILSRLKLSERNFDAAWKLLALRFEKPRAILYTYLDELAAIPKVGRDPRNDLQNLRDVAYDIYYDILGLGRPIDKWEDQFIHAILCKLDPVTRHHWELSQTDFKSFPTFQQIDEFLSLHIEALKNSGLTTPIGDTRFAAKPAKRSSVKVHQVTAQKSGCFLCASDHPLFQCPKFLGLSVEQRLNSLKGQDRCYNCFRKGHRPRNCSSSSSCRICHMKHHTLLHAEGRRSNDAPSEAAGSSSDAPSTSRRSNELHVNFASVESCDTIIPTITVRLTAPTGRAQIVRALLDQGAQVSLITESAAQSLRLRKQPVSVSVSGYDGGPSEDIRYSASFHIEPCDRSEDPINVTALIVKRMTSYIPALHTVTDLSAYFPDITLADKSFGKPEQIQLIIGSDYYGEILREGLIRAPSRGLIAQKTAFGWIASGPYPQAVPSPRRVVVNHACISELHSAVQKFWELEEIPSSGNLIASEDEEAAENIFLQSHRRLPDGRFAVRLPFKGSQPPSLGDTKELATRAFLRQEVRLSKDSELRAAYSDFLSEYLALGHMEEVPPRELSGSNHFYLPHHPVFKRAVTPRKVRVVFNASFKSSNSTSLNDHLLVGPKLQANLGGLILKWRSHPIVVSTDLEKMFRQIRVETPDRDFQRIVWRCHPTEPLKVYRLSTVTYGTACAPFLANRVLKQLALLERSNFPTAADIVENNVYVDDVMFGGDTVEEVRPVVAELTHLLMAGGFRCHKWTSNSASLLANFEASERASCSSKAFGEDTHHKILGLSWDPSQDHFQFQVTDFPLATTKRAFLSLISRVFDPLGWIAPVIITSKLLLQSLWLTGATWDAPLPKELAKACNRFQEELRGIAEIRVPRWTGQGCNQTDLQLHGFCDASNSAYAACIFLRIGHDYGRYKTSLVFAKTRVAPLKTISVPRLELCAATLLARTVRFVQTSMGLDNCPIFCWSDSTVTLAWIRSHPSRWKTFVANRVSEIHTLLPNVVWGHVPTDQNPADCASRGISPAQLLQHQMWWSGPIWLSQDSSHWPFPSPLVDISDPPELRKTELVANAIIKSDFPLPDRVSSWPKLLRVIAYMYRFIHCRKHVNRTGSLVVSPVEIKHAAFIICKLTQAGSFPRALETLRLKGHVLKDRALRTLNLFLDDEGLIRIGGRLSLSGLPHDEKHPILLPACRVSKLLIEYYHGRSLHGGLQLTLRLLRQHYWVVNARSLTKQCIRSCLICARHRAKLSCQFMGNLPPPRVTPSRPFSNVGIDYAGPFHIRAYKGRGHKAHKGYIALFICLSVKAIHLECVHDCSTAGFLAAFDRFAARRGLPAHIYSDNGSNFIGADKELSRSLQALLRDPELHAHCASDGVEWHFIPPAAPHFGGLWEAGVKSVKFHLKRVMGNTTPTFEEFNTALCKIESVLNSRPLVPLYDDPESFDVLTPGHFLVGSLLTSVPNPSVLEVPESRLSRWQQIQQRQESFWKVWSQDYLNTLQQRHKWSAIQPNLSTGTLVIIKSPQLPPGKWNLGRIINTFPGPDGLVRVVEVRTAYGTLKRPVTQICVLPVETAESQLPRR